MRSLYNFKVLVLAAVTFLPCGAASANVWVDERFEDGPFTQGTGVTNAVPSAELDTYSTNALNKPVTNSPLTHTGSVASTTAFEGANSYQLSPGQTLSVGSNYQDPANGDLQMFQFAVKVNPVPAAGTIGEFRWNHDYNNASAGGENSFFVRLVSTGSAVNVIGGEDLAHATPVTGSLGTLSGTNSWAYITMLLNKNNATTTDSRANVVAAYPGGLVPAGMNFHNSSNTSLLNIPALNGDPTTFTAGSWAFTVSSGTVYIDDIYWDGGLSDDDANANDRPFNKTATPPARVEDWRLM